MGEVGCSNDGKFQNLRVEGIPVFTSGLKGIGGGGIIIGGGIGLIAAGGTPTITAALMLDNSVLNYASGTDVTGALWDTGTNIDTALRARGIVPAVGMSFDVYVNNSDASVFVWGALAAGITSKSGAATDPACQLPVAAPGLSGCGHFRFVRTGANTYDLYNLGMAAS